jgi:hypothetical protein
LTSNDSGTAGSRDRLPSTRTDAALSAPQREAGGSIHALDALVIDD